MKKIFTLLLALCTLSGYAQTEKKENPFQTTPLKWHLSKDKKSYVGFGLTSQFWSRSVKNNPGTLGQNGEPQNNSFNFGIRRFRMIFKGSINNNFFFFTQLGSNNINFGSTEKTPDIFFHDAWGMFNIVDKKLYLGAGLHYFAGVSRLTSLSTSSQLTLDHPLFNFPTVNRTDDTRRQLGIFAMGTLDRLNYRVAMNQPYQYGKFKKNLLALKESEKAKYTQSTELRTDAMNFKGYFFYQFKDVIHTTSSALPMTYLGSKSVFNIGAGFDYMSDAYAHFDLVGNKYELQVQNQLNIGVDLFFEKPYFNKSVFTVYASYNKYDMGDDFLRSIGVMNVGLPNTGNSKPLPQGPGNKYYTTGTGNIYYTQIGYLLPDKMQIDYLKFQTFAAFTLQDFEALSDKGTVYDFGVNCLLNKQNLKLTAQYSLRPIFDKPNGQSQEIKLIDHLETFLLQLQFKI